MTRFSCAAAALVAALGIACSGSEGAAPTAPSAAPSTSSSGGSAPPTTSSCLPAAPGGLRVTVDNTVRTFTWNSVSNAQDYFIQIAKTGSSDPFLVDTNTSQTNYTWSGQSGGNYWARVYARNSCGSGPNSESISFN
jgi:hypothetical protein